MADLRIVDAPEIPTENITGEEKLPTGGNGNYSISLDSLADYTKTKKDLADNTSVDGKVNGVRQELESHIEDLLNPHQVTKNQIGLGNVDNTADADKPVSNSTQAAIISAVAPKADKTYVDNQLTLKANKADVYTKQESSDLVNNSISAALTPVNASLELAKRGIINRYDSSLTYNSGERVVLTNGDIVKSTIDGNVTDPNVDMTGWVNPEAEQKDINNQRPTVLQLAKVIGDGVADDTVELQKVFRDADDNRKSYVFIPFHNNNYLINAPLVLQEPAMIYGDKGATYNGGVGKDGWIIIGSTAEYALNLGNERVYSPTTQNVATKQTRNYADNWELKNIGFKPANGVAARTKTGIKHTARTNGPDRGMTIREISAYSLKYAVHITNQNLSTQLATLVIENSCLSQCDIPVFAEGNVLGLRFVGNQCEQNYSGAIHGAFNAGVTIEDNMLEGQTNAINIYPTQFGNRPKISIKRNYFERNSGQYVMKVSATSGDCELDVGGNYYFSPMADDYILLDDGVWLVKNTDPHPITLNAAAIRAGSEIFGAGINYYKQREIRASGHGGFVYIKDFLSLNTPTTETSATFSTSYPSIETPFGLLRYAEANSQYLTVNVPVTEGDLFSVSMLVSCNADFEDAQIQVYNPDYSAVIGQGSGGFYFAQSAKAGMVLLTLTFKSLVTAASLRVRIQSTIKATGGRKIFGVSARNYGAYVAGGAKNIYPAMPKLNPVVGRVAAQADSVATDVAGLKNDLNALLTKLRNSGTMNP